ncbi:MAG: histidine phosphatase family protein [Sphingobium sp.]
MTVQILLVRHAVHAEVGKILTGRGVQVSLSDVGVGQAVRLTDALADRLVAAIQSSPQLRCRETAEILAQRLNATVQIVDALDEIDFGAWTGMGFPELEHDPLWQRWNSERSAAAPPGGENMTQAVGRCVDHLAALTPGPSQTVLCVTHADIIRGIIAHFLGLSLDNILRFDVDPASVSELLIGPDWARLTSLNRTFA